MVGATLGTSVIGAIDPLAEIAKVCKKHGVWLHADGALAGSFLVSDNLVKQLDGI